MLTLEATLAAAGRQRLERMVAQVDLIAGSVASAEILAHDVPTEHKEIDVRDSLDEAWLAFEAEADRHGLDFVNDIPGGSEEHTSELQSLMRIPYSVFCL